VTEPLELNDPFRIGKVFTIAQTANLVKVSQKTVRNWLYGISATPIPKAKAEFGTPNPKIPYEMTPVLGEAKPKVPDEVARVSFLELSELIVVAQFREHGIKLPRIQKAHAYARQQWHLSHPFAHYNLTTLGGHILREFEEREPGPGRFVVLSSPGQYVLPVFVEEVLSEFDYSAKDNSAERWHLYGREIPAVIDPRFGGGKPTIEGRGVSVEILVKRWRAHEPIRSIAKDFRLAQANVEAVLQRVA